MPSPASYFMSEQTIKKLDEEKFALMEKKMKKEEKKDHTCPQVCVIGLLCLVGKGSFTYQKS